KNESQLHITRTKHVFFFFNETATTENYTLSLHDALPISVIIEGGRQTLDLFIQAGLWDEARIFRSDIEWKVGLRAPEFRHSANRSEEHTSELQSRENLVCRLLLEKKNNEVYE